MKTLDIDSASSLAALPSLIEKHLMATLAALLNVSQSELEESDKSDILGVGFSPVRCYSERAYRPLISSTEGLF